jgi:hypothetical protein
MCVEMIVVSQIRATSTRVGMNIRPNVLLLLLFFAPALLPAADDMTAKLAAFGRLSRRRKGGYNAWMLTSSALVLMMTGPGLALFYVGLVRRKNVLGTMMQTSFLWYSLR